jgi:hypothetical protein
MYIIIGQDNLVFTATESYSYQENGNPVTAENMAFANYLVKEIKEVTSLPADFADTKYFYTDTDGFILNDNWLDPNFALDPIETQKKLNVVVQLQEANKTADQKYKDIDLTTAALTDVQNAKMDQLDEACNNTIVDGFDTTINGTSYKFSCSLAAQANFQGTDTLFKDGAITSAEWTVINNDTGKTERINIDQTTFNTLKLQVFQHINSNISKLRNTLQPQVEAATTNADVDKINW